MSVFDELRRRNVFRMAGLYLVGAWLLVQVSSTLLPMFGAPGWVSRAIVIGLLAGFLPALAFSWVFELTPDGLKKDSGSDGTAAPHVAMRMQRLTLVLALLALAYLAFDKFVLTPQRQQATVVAAMAKSAGDAQVATRDNSIAVLPFVNMSSDREQEYFSDGISEELLNQLAQIPELRVIARTSSFAFKGKDVGVAEIARQLNVAHLLEGSIRKSGNKIRITAQLIRTADSSHLWSETYDRDVADIFAVQDEISTAVVSQLKLKLLGEAPKARKTDPRAFALFLQGRASWRLNTETSIVRAIAQLKEAVAIDPGYADAWSGLSLSYLIQSSSNRRRFPDNERLVVEAANSALKADPGNAPAHARLANAAEVYRGDLVTSALHLQRALALGPSNTDVVDEVGNLYRSLARPEQAIVFHHYATRLDPMSAYAHSHLGYDYAAVGRFDEAIGSGRIALALSPDSEEFRFSYVVPRLAKADWPAVLEELATWPEGAGRRLALTQAMHGLGRKAESDAALAELISRDGDTWPFFVATAFAMRGDADQAFKWIDKTLAQSPAWLNGAMKDPALVNLRDDRRWLPKLRSLGQAPEQVAAIQLDVVVPAAP